MYGGMTLDKKEFDETISDKKASCETALGVTLKKKASFNFSKKYIVNFKLKNSVGHVNELIK